MDARNREKLKEVLRAIKVPRHCDIPTANISFNSDYFDEMVLIPLEKLAEWSEEDEKAVIEKARIIKKETPNGEFRNRFDRIKKVLKERKAWIIGGGITIGLITAGIALLRRNNKKEESEDKTEKR